MRMLAVIMTSLLAALGWQSWRLHDAQQQINTQQAAIQNQNKKLTQKNSQLIALNILVQTSNREQMKLYAAAEETSALLQQRQRQIEELTRENETLRRWAAASLPDAVIRLRQRPAITGGQSFRQWLSQNNALSSGSRQPTQ